MKQFKNKSVLILITALFAVTTAAQTTQGLTTNINANLISTDPVPLQSGEQGDLSFKIRNSGGTEAQNVKVELVDNYPFQIKQDRKKSYEFGEMSPGQEYQISTEVVVADDAPDGSNDFKARIISGQLNRTVNIPVEVQSNDIELNLANLATQPDQLMPDTENNKLSIDLVNNGEKKAENVVLNLETPEFFEQTSSFSTRKSLGNINPGERKTAAFNLGINESAPAGMAQLQTVTTYSADDSTNSIEETEDFSVNIEGKPQFEIESVESDLRTGKTEQLSLKVRNTGEEKSSSTRIRVMDSSDQPFTYDSSNQYIGTLQPGQTGEAAFEVETDTDAEVKKYLIDFQVRGVKGTEVFVEDETVEAGVQNGPENNGSPLLPVLVVLGLVAAILFVFRDRVRELFNSEDNE